jgi:hypothetical protein
MRKPTFVVLTCLLACAIVVLGGLFAALHSPWALSRLAGAFGYDVHARAISLSPSLSGSISGLSVTNPRSRAVALHAANVTLKNSLEMILRGEIERLELRHPKFSFRLGAAGGGAFDLSFLTAVPRIGLLNIQEAEALLTFEGSRQRMHLENANLTVKNYSSQTGGSITFQTHFDFTGGGKTAFMAKGTLTGDFHLSSVSPQPSGKGTLTCVIDSGQYTADNRTVSLGGISLALDMAYDRHTETFRLTSLRGESASFGTVRGSAEALLRGNTPWSVNLSATSIDFAQDDSRTGGGGDAASGDVRPRPTDAGRDRDVLDQPGRV